MKTIKSCSMIVFFMITYNSYSCICPTLNKLTKSEINAHSIAFEATVLEVIKIDSLGYFEVKLKIEQYLLNGQNKDQEIVLTTPIMSGMCKVRMEIGEQWFIFLNDRQNVHITECDRTFNINNIKRNKMNLKLPKEIRREYSNKYKMYKSDRKLLKTLKKE